MANLISGFNVNGALEDNGSVLHGTVQIIEFGSEKYGQLEVEYSKELRPKVINQRP
jgi:hypothetical protein